MKEIKEVVRNNENEKQIIQKDIENSIIPSLPSIDSTLCIKDMITKRKKPDFKMDEVVELKAISLINEP